MVAAMMLVGSLPLVTTAGTTEESFDEWLKELRIEALTRGIEVKTLEAALAGVKPIPRVLELDRNQPEFTLSFAQYRSRVINQSRINMGRKLMAEHRALLEQVGRKYGVQPRFIVALWGIESDFGRQTGGFQVIASLATLAHDGRRSAFFRRELFKALQILNEGHIAPAEMKGSWAGAMGQSQFMPSSFLNFAVDFDRDGRRDIWNSRPDVFASIANYLSSSGWLVDQTWGRAVRLPENFDQDLIGLNTSKRIGQWQELGVRQDDGAKLPARQLRASIIIPERDRPEVAFMVYSNFRATLKWNRSIFFASAVGLLSDAIAK